MSRGSLLCLYDRVVIHVIVADLPQIKRLSLGIAFQHPDSLYLSRPIRYRAASAYRSPAFVANSCNDASGRAP